MQYVYSREINPNVDDSLARIVSMIPDGARVLDVGTGSGALGRYLGRRQCRVDGLTYAEAEAELARPSYARLQLMDLEETLPSSVFGDTRYDRIVCADILEHVRHPATVLADLRALLAPDGRILISFPNATHMGVIAGLMGGRFARPQEGLLDITHVQFMDRQGLKTLVRGADLRVVECRDVRRNLHQTEFAGMDFTALPPVIRSYVASLPDADVFQFIWMLEAGADAGETQQPTVMPVINLKPGFAARLFQDRGDGFDATPCAYGWGALDEEAQTIVFDELDLTNTRALRLSPGDRPGLAEFFHLRLLDKAGTPVWEWTGDHSAALDPHECELTGIRGLNAGRLLRLTGGNAGVSFVAPPSGCWGTVVRAELRMTAPLPYADAAFAWAERRQQSLTRMLEELYAAREHAVGERDAAHAERNALQDALAAVYASTSWRRTAWLRALKRWLTGSPEKTVSGKRSTRN
jgi:2-polyprenyl-3-methyl-5-hydroxy-6-metoxy-1,4-benzoquinol methylase